MSQEIVVVFLNKDEASRCDLSRVGIVAGGSDDGLAVIVEPDIDGWDWTHPDVAMEILRSGMAACGVRTEVSPRKTRA